MKNTIIYYFAFILVIILRLCISSELIKVDPKINFLITLLIIFLFLLKLLLDKYTIKKLIVSILLFLVFLYIYYKTGIAFLLISYLSFISIKNVNINRIIKIDIFIKLLFLVTHGFLYFSNFLFNKESILSIITETSKGVSHNLYFANPNTVGALVLFLIFDIYYLKNKIRVKNLIFGFVVMFVVYYITKSRTPFYSFLIFILIYFIKNVRIIDFLNRYLYLILTFISYIIVKYMQIGSVLYERFNKLFSGRLYYSIMSFKETGLNIIPNSLNNTFFETYIIDNYYVRCFVYFGLIVLVLFYIPNILLQKKLYMDKKKINIISIVYLFFETVPINVGYSVNYLVMGDLLLNENINKEVKKNEKDS